MTKRYHLFAFIFIFPILLTALWLFTPSATATPSLNAFTINSSLDAHDLNPGDNLCDTGNTIAGQPECTLRAAIEEANFTLGPDTLTLPNNIYTLTLDYLPILTGSLTINGANATIAGNKDDNLLFVAHNASATINNTSFRYGGGGCINISGIDCFVGGAITNYGQLHLDTCLVYDNQVTGNGGAIYNKHHLTLTNCLLEKNLASQVGGALYSNGYTYTSTVTITNTTFQSNYSTNGGAIYFADAAATIDNSNFLRNASFGTPTNNSFGGAISIKSSALPNEIIITNTLFKNNYSEANGGAIFNSHLLEVTDSDFQYNYTAHQGGAIFSQIKYLTVTNSIFYSNTAGYYGGAIYQNSGRNLSLNNSAIINNHSRSGGGLYLEETSYPININNTTLSANQATNQGGAIYTESQLNLNYTTIASNTAPSGDGIYIASKETILANSILANQTNNCLLNTASNSTADITSSGHNVVDNTTNCPLNTTTNDQYNLPANLGPLNNHGGPLTTLTHNLLPTSPALDNAANSDCPPTDQRGISRPYNTTCDSGAFEYDPATTTNNWTPPPPPIPFTFATYPTPQPGTTFVVNTTSSIDLDDTNPGDGICDNGTIVLGQPACTVWAAIQESNALPGHNTIQLANRTYSAPTNKRYTLTDHLTITGAGPDQSFIQFNSTVNGFDVPHSTYLTIDNLTINGNYQPIRLITSYGRLTMTNCTIKNARDTAIILFYFYHTTPLTDPYPDLTVDNCLFDNNVSTSNGGAILANGAVTVTNSIFQNNGADRGAAIYSTGGAGVTNNGDIHITDSIFNNNTANYNGSAIRSRWSRITIDNTQFNNNTTLATSGTDNGGVIDAVSTITITNSVFNNNTGAQYGGALSNDGNWGVTLNPSAIFIANSLFISNSADYGGALSYANSATIRNSTLSQNQAGRDGGAIYIASESDGDFANLTIYENQADASNFGVGRGGGIHLNPGLFNQPGSIIITNTVVASNTAPTGPDCFIPLNTSTSGGYNFISQNNDCLLPFLPTDDTGTPFAAPLDPQLAPLTNIDNHNAVYIPLPGSPLIDTGNCSSPDQRGEPRPLCDRGAAEWTPPRTFTVNSTAATTDAERGDGLCADINGNCTFIAALNEANTWAFADEIHLPAGTFPSYAAAIYNDDLIISGQGADQTFLDGGNIDRVFDIPANPDLNLTLRDLTIQNGYVSGFPSGAGIYNRLNLTLERVIVQNNQAGNGAGITNATPGTLTMVDSAIINNTAYYNLSGAKGTGGALQHISDNPVTLTNVTISGNYAGRLGGGIYHTGSGQLTLNSLTIANNTADTAYGGGIVTTNNAIVTLINTAIADNTAATADTDCYGYFDTSLGRNAIETVTSNCNLTAPVNTGDPNLYPLADNGGRTPTHSYLDTVNHPLFAQGTNCLGTDQRGNIRFNACDIGAFELGSYRLQPNISLVNNYINLTWPSRDIHYQIYRAPTPYYTPQPSYYYTTTTAATTFIDPDNTPLATPETNLYYLVQPIAATNLTTAEYHILGAFTYALTTGN
ncbi:MAG TPA: choice-of-anchor Q domain-containing protein [Anaerolineae bacterium]|nr:choice-of-anchor Q domain-containing protein [Anaerolineae bacterium]